MKYFSLFFCILLVSCTNKEVYESIQSNQKNKCFQEPTPSLQEKCKETLMPYKDYEKLRNDK